MQTAPIRDSDRWRLIEDLFHAALELDRGSRPRFLEQACGSDTDLRQQVESLLSGVEESTVFVESAVQGVARAYLAHESATQIEPDVCLDHYRVVRMLGSGGMGEVYLAEDIRLSRRVALKLLPPHLTRDSDSLKRFEQEARLLSSLNHPNLLTVFEFCHAEGRDFLVTELVEGQSLREVLNGKQLDPDTAIDITTQVASALTAAHASGVIHRDIKPENIIVRPDGCVKVLDFGIAKLAESEAEAAGLTRRSGESLTVAGAMLGTPRYMSPEQIRGLPLDARTDVFSLGAVLYEMLAGSPPFAGETASDVIADVLRGEPEKLEDHARNCPSQLRAIVSRALTKDRDRRYQSASDLFVELQRFRHEHHVREATERIRRRWLASALAIAALLTAVFFALRLSQPDHRNITPRSLAVLPFRNLRPDPNTDFLGFSLADEVTTKLGYVKGLTMRPASAIGRYRDSGSDVRAAAADLRADMIVTGTYIKDGSDLRITARLITFHPEAVLWQNTLNVKYDNLLTVQDRVAQMIVQRLALPLGPDEHARLGPGRPVNHLAYEYYLRGIDLYSLSNFPSAIAMLEKSVAIDPTYAPTWASLGRAYTTNASLDFGGRDDYRRAEQAYERAIALNPALPEPRIYMANLLTDTGRVELSVPLLRTALESSPNNAEAHWELGYAYRFGGMLNESVAECELARRLDPEVKINSSALNSYLYLGEYDRFLKSLPSNDSALLVFYRGFVEYHVGQRQAAVAEFTRAYELSPDLLQAQVGKALAYEVMGHPASGLKFLEDTANKMNERGVSDPEAMYKVAEAYAILGDTKRALTVLDQSVLGGFFCYPYIARDPLLNPLHGRAEYNQILQQARQRWQQFEQRFGETS
ncbi:MAG: protein kinase [Acidobacteriaceae bacterium]|nr:protein kinase [Acidobacteriaceae bacterium]